MNNNWLNYLILLYVYQEKYIKIDICKTANKFINGKNSRKESFSYARFHNMRVDTVLDKG